MFKLDLLSIWIVVNESVIGKLTIFTELVTKIEFEFTLQTSQFKTPCKCIPLNPGTKSKYECSWFKIVLQLK